MPDGSWNKSTQSVPKSRIILKGGISKAGTRAAVSHTGSMASDRAIWETLFKQTGAVSVQSLDEMAEATYCLLHLQPLCRMQAAVVGVRVGATASNGDVRARERHVVPVPKAMGGTLELLNADPEIDVVLMKIPSHILSGVPGDLLGVFVKTLGEFAEKHAGAKPIVVAPSEDACLGMTDSGVRGLRRGGIVAFSSSPKASRALPRPAGYHKAMDDR